MVSISWLKFSSGGNFRSCCCVSKILGLIEALLIERCDGQLAACCCLQLLAWVRLSVPVINSQTLRLWFRSYTKTVKEHCCYSGWLCLWRTGVIFSVFCMRWILMISNSITFFFPFLRVEKEKCSTQQQSLESSSETHKGFSGHQRRYSHSCFHLASRLNFTRFRLRFHLLCIYLDSPTSPHVSFLATANHNT